MLEELKNIYRNVIGNDDIEITPKTKLNSKRVSSFGKIQLICAVEDAFDIEIPNSEAKKLKTVQDLMNLITKLKQ